MVDRGLVQEISGRGESDDPRRRYYRVSPLGHSVLSGEVARLEVVLRDARLRLARAKPREA